MIDPAGAKGGVAVHDRHSDQLITNFQQTMPPGPVAQYASLTRPTG